MKNLNPLYEFLGHATAGAVGLIFGHGIAETKNDKEQSVSGGEIIDLVTDAVTNAKEQTESLY